MLYQGGTPQIGDAVAVKSIGRVNTGVAAGPRSSDICDSAESAMGRNSPAAPNLISQCYSARIAKIAQGEYRPTKAFSPNDPAYRVALTNAGQAVVNASPELRQRVARMPTDGTDRGFTMAQGVRAGLVDPGFVQWVQAGLTGPTLKAFNDALAEPAGGSVQLTQGPAAPADTGGTLGGIPRPVLIGGAAVAVLGVAALVFKLTR